MNTKAILSIVVILVVAAAGGYVMLSGKDSVTENKVVAEAPQDNTTQETVAEAVAPEPPVQAEPTPEQLAEAERFAAEKEQLRVAAAAAAEAAVELEEEAAAEDVEPAASDSSFDVNKALTQHGIGDPDAPVKITEYASLSCPHCAHFHKETYDKLKAEFIDTGKVYFTFVDFPLNGPALDGTIAARCLPTDKYYQFIKFLFDTQEKWAFEDDYMKIVRQNAKLVGATDEMLDACYASEALKEGIAENMKSAQERFQISSTPSFVINKSVIIKGAQSFDVFAEQINKIIEEQNETE